MRISSMSLVQDKHSTASAGKGVTPPDSVTGGCGILSFADRVFPGDGISKSWTREDFLISDEDFAGPLMESGTGNSLISDEEIFVPTCG